MRVIVVCAGTGKLWADHLGVPKQLAPVGGEPILHRTVRLFSEFSDDIVIVAEDERMAVPGARMEPPIQDPAMGKMGRFWSSRHLWHPTDRTLVLFGDVFWDENAVKKVAASKVKGWRWLARLDVNERTGKMRPEGFGVSFYPQHHAEFTAAIERAADLWRRKITNRCLGFECWRVMQGVPDEEVRHPHPFPDVGRCIVIDDWTDDIDRPGEHDRLVLRWAEAAPYNPDAVSVVIPWRDTGCERRRALLDYCIDRYRATHPDWEVVLGSDGRTSGPFNRAAALINGIGESSGGVIVVMDGDIWSDRLTEAVDAVRSGESWVMPHDRCVRLTEAASDKFIGGTDPDELDIAECYDEKPYRQRAGAVPMVIRRELALRFPPDQRFNGWGGEENAWGWALETLHGPVTRMDGTAWHLWHPPQQRMKRHVGNPRNHALRRRYERAANKPAAMERLVAEARGEAEEAPVKNAVEVWKHSRTGRRMRAKTGSDKARRLEEHPLWEPV